MAAQDADAIKAQKIYASAEGPVREWIAQHVGSPVSDLFGKGFVGAEPVLFEMEKLCGVKGKYLQLKLAVVPHDFKHNIRQEVLSKKIVQDSVQFLAYATNVVYVTTLKTMENPPDDIQLAWDPVNFIYRPQYAPKELQEYRMCRHVLTQIDKTPDKAKKAGWEDDRKKYSARAEELKPVVDAMEEEVKQKNAKLATSHGISIDARYLKRDQLPAGTFSKHVRPVAATMYQDPQ